MQRVELGVLYLLGVPLVLASGAAWLQASGGARRLWIGAAIGTALLGTLALVTKQFMLHGRGPLSAAFVETWTLPASLLASATATQLLYHRRVPMLARIALASVAALVFTSAGFGVA